MGSTKHQTVVIDKLWTSLPTSSVTNNEFY